MHDLINRQAAIDAVSEACFELRGVFGRCEDALKALPSAQPDRELIEQLRWERDTAIQQLKDLGYGLGEKPRTDDTISRQAAIDAIVAWTVEDRPDIEMPTDLVGRIEALPSAYPERCECCETLSKTQLLIPQPERKRGKWLWFDGVRCSNCNHKLETTGLTSYCPNCGADMRGEGHE